MNRCAAVLVAAVFALPVRAQVRSLGEGAPAVAEQRYQIGLEAYRAGRYAEAVREFRVAQTLYSTSPVLAYNLGRSLERTGDLDAAIASYRTYLTLSPDAEDRLAVEAFIAALEAERARQAGSLQVSSIPDGAAVFVDNEREAPRGATPTTLRLTPGEHTLRLTLDGHEPAQRTVKVTAHETASVSVELRALASSDLDTVGWVLGGVGVAAVALGGVFHGLAASTSAEGDDLAVGEADARDELQTELETRRAVMWTGYGVGLGLLGAATALILWPDDSVAAAPTPGGFALGGTW